MLVKNKWSNYFRFSTSDIKIENNIASFEISKINGSKNELSYSELDEIAKFIFTNVLDKYHIDLKNIYKNNYMIGFNYKVAIRVKGKTCLEYFIENILLN